MHVHILGIGGTFMGGLAVLAKELNLKVTGADGPLYPPMSTQLQAQGIDLIQGYGSEQIQLQPECFVVGNVMKRGMPIIEAILDQGLPFMSGPEWLAKQVLKNRQVLAVSGTHGKTTTSSMLAWILEYAGQQPGFLIGGIPNNFGVSARLGNSPYFVVEADEYDSAFFDKRSKFIHYLPKILIINNIEFDHADIFSSLDAIKTQFHHLVRTIPQSGKIIVSGKDKAIEEVLQKGCWTPVTRFYADVADRKDRKDRKENQKIVLEEASDSYADLYAKPLTAACDRFEIWQNNQKLGEVRWGMLGKHNVENALAAISAATAVGISYETAIQALAEFKGVKRRLEIKAETDTLRVYDDFAHHPTAIQTTLAGLRGKGGRSAKIRVIVDIRSNTMKAGCHQGELGRALQEADEVYFFKTKEVTWNVENVMQTLGKSGGVFSEPEELLDVLRENLGKGMGTAENKNMENSAKHSVENKEHVIFMSNGGFAGMIQSFLEKVKER